MAEFLAVRLLFPWKRRRCADRSASPTDPRLPVTISSTVTVYRGCPPYPAGHHSLRVFNDDGARGASRPVVPSGRGDTAFRSRLSAGSPQLHFRRDFQGHLSRFMFLKDQNVRHPAAADHLQPDIPPDSRVGKAGTPVPPELAVNLSQMRETGVPSVLGQRAASHFPRRYSAGGVEPDADLVFPAARSRGRASHSQVRCILSASAHLLPVQAVHGPGYPAPRSAADFVRLQVLPVTVKGCGYSQSFSIRSKAALSFSRQKGSSMASGAQQIRIDRPGRLGLAASLFSGARIPRHRSRKWSSSAFPPCLSPFSASVSLYQSPAETSIPAGVFS